MKRLFIIAVSLMLCACSAFAFSGCGGGKKLIVATSPDFAPFEYREPGTNNIVGFDIELITEIAKRMDVKIEIKAMDFDGILSAVNTKTVDIGISGFTITDDRKENVLFSDPYINNHQVVVARANDSRFDGIEDIEALEALIKDMKIGACLGYVGATVAEWYTEDITTYENITIANTALTTESIDCYIMDFGVATAAANNNSAVKVLNISLVDEDYGIIVNLSKTGLIADINAKLAELKVKGNDGKSFIDNLKEKYNIE